MISLMTYNLGDNGENNISSIIDVIKKEASDILVLNEVGWLNKKPYTLEWLSTELSLPYFIFGKSNKSVNHVAIFSKFHLKNATVVNGLQNAGIVTIVKTELGDISVAGVHLAPNTEDTRLAEITNIFSQQKNCQFKIILGDLNSISSENGVKDDFLIFGEKPRYEVIERIKKEGYVDAAEITQKQQICTVSLTRDNGIVYHNLRLDYIFLSNSLVKHGVDYHVVVNKTTRKCSDHYPITVNIH